MNLRVLVNEEGIARVLIAMKWNNSEKWSELWSWPWGELVLFLPRVHVHLGFFMALYLALSDFTLLPAWAKEIWKKAPGKSKKGIGGVRIKVSGFKIVKAAPSYSSRSRNAGGCLFVFPYSHMLYNYSNYRHLHKWTTEPPITGIHGFLPPVVIPISCPVCKA